MSQILRGGNSSGVPHFTYSEWITNVVVKVHCWVTLAQPLPLTPLFPGAPWVHLPAGTAGSECFITWYLDPWLHYVFFQLRANASLFSFVSLPHHNARLSMCLVAEWGREGGKGYPLLSIIANCVLATINHLSLSHSFMPNMPSDKKVSVPFFGWRHRLTAPCLGSGLPAYYLRGLGINCSSSGVSVSLTVKPKLQLLLFCLHNFHLIWVSPTEMFNRTFFFTLISFFLKFISEAAFKSLVLKGNQLAIKEDT